MLYAVQRRIKNEEHMIHTLIHINPCMFIARGRRTIPLSVTQQNHALQPHEAHTEYKTQPQ